MAKPVVNQKQQKPTVSARVVCRHGTGLAFPCNNAKANGKNNICGVDAQPCRIVGFC